ncbi:tyrosine-type recombinase/integrase [Hamadaea tsunoensis]|uniref:tyrosine-type recombinase/integrase n=1 Tax=Hamadaea tsunoensis TaxID=53368 RepID=UPI00040C88B6|nr:site-specific integrase [Hamadaea tsunoensis]
MTSRRHNGEGSIFPYRNGYAAYVWVTKPDGTRDRKYVYGKDRETVHDKWLKLHQQAKQGPIATTAMTVGKFVVYWLREIVEPNLSPGTYVTYEGACRNYIVPGLGGKRLDRLANTDVQTWLNHTRRTCQCCAQGKDARRPTVKQRCCALGNCCQDLPSDTTVRGLRRIIRAMITCAIDAGLVSQNVAKKTRLPKARRPKRTTWTSAQARQFLEYVRVEDERFYAAYVLLLVLGLRKGEILGLTWDQIDLDSGELVPNFQVQRVGKQLLRREVKTETSEQPLPLPGICVVALRRHRDGLVAAGKPVEPDDLLFTTVTGMPVEPRNFNRYWDRAVWGAGVVRITVRAARATCATLLKALNVHPRIAQRILRHAQVSITMEIYTDVIDDDTRDALGKLGDLLE